ncbi:MAG: TonB-dependent receptor, partial [Acidobacteriota bacterium]
MVNRSRSIRIRGRAGIVWLVLLVLAPTTLIAEGIQTGVLSGVVVDAEDRPLPAVEVWLSGTQGRQSVTSDDRGRFRFPALLIGSYAVSAEMLGLRASRSDLRVYIDKTTEVVLRLPSADDPPAPPTAPEERIQVLAVAPLIDRFATRVGASVSREFLEDLPLARFYQNGALLLPGVGGGEDGNPNVAGALRAGNLFLVDGVDTTDATTGLFGLNLSYDAIHDIDVVTAALPIEYGRASGAIINAVTRSGKNDLAGSVRWLLTHNDWTEDYRHPARALQPEIEAANAGLGGLDGSLAATFGGPLSKLADKLWFFTAAETSTTAFHRPTVQGTSAQDARWDQDTSISSGAVKLTWKPGQHQMLIGQLTADAASFTTFAPFDRTPGENRANPRPSALRSTFFNALPGDIFALQERSQDGEFAKVEWSTTRSNGLTLTATAALQDRRLERDLANRRRAADGAADGAPHEATLPDAFRRRAPVTSPSFAIWNGLTEQGVESRRRDQASVTADAFVRSGEVEHDLRFGIDLQSSGSRFGFNVSGRDGIDPATGRAVEGQLFIDLDRRPECLENSRCTDFDPLTGNFQPFRFFNFWRRESRATEANTLALFVNDSLNFGRWLVSVGLRLETVRGLDDIGRRLVDDTSVAPRFGVKADLSGDGRTLLSATFSRFSEPFPQQFLDDFVRDQPFSGFSVYAWSDPTGNTCAEVDPADFNAPCWVFLEIAPFRRLQVDQPNLRLRRSAVEEWVVTVERRLNPNSDLRVSWIRRDWRDLWDDRFLVTSQRSAENLPEAERWH